MLADELDNGALLYDLMGPVEEVRQVTIDCLRAIRAAGARRIIALDPTCARFFKRECEEWGLLEGLEVCTATAYVEELIGAGKLRPRQAEAGAEATLHDPCRLARDLDETGPARGILRAMGYSIREMFLSGKDTKCCGGPVLQETRPEIARMVSEARWEDARATGAALLVTACPACLHVMREAPAGMRLQDLFVLLNAACE